MNNPSQISITPEGDLLMAQAVLIAVNGTTQAFWTGQGGAIAATGGGLLQGAAGAGVSFEGGSGRNVKVTANTAADLVDHRWFSPVSPDLWASAFNGALSVTRDPGTGALSLGDGTDEIAASGTGFAALTGVASFGTFAVVNWVLDSESLGNKIWLSPDDVNAALVLDKTTGYSMVTYGSGIAEMERLSGSTSDPSGVYTATATGETNWNSGNPWSYSVSAVGGSSSSLASTAYGEATYNSGSPFTIELEREGGTDWTARMAYVIPSAGTMQAGFYPSTGWGAWGSSADPLWTIQINPGTGWGEISDGTDVVMTRAPGPLYDPGQDWISTPYGDATFNGGDAFSAIVGLQRAATLPGVVYVTMARDSGTGEATGLTGPFWDASGLPANTSTEIHWPVAEIGSDGTPRQILFGAIVWVPNP